MKVYAAFDLHSRSSHVAVVDEHGKLLAKAKVKNDIQIMLVTLEPYRQELSAIAVESTFNWYWLVSWNQATEFVLPTRQPSRNTGV